MPILHCATECVRERCRSAAAVLAALLCLAACAPTALPPDEARRILSERCQTLTEAKIEASQIGLKSGPVTIDQAKFSPAVDLLVTSRGTVNPARPDYCQVLGNIGPVDGEAPPIHFQLNLPVQWNGKAVQYGGSSLNGVLISGLEPLRDAPIGAPLTLARGYVTYGTDSGHRIADQPRGEIAAWALNDEALENFAYASYKKVRDVAVALSTLYYQRPPERIYFYGGSEGGREGLAMAQRFPEDFDGVVSVVPVINWVGLLHAFLPVQRLQLEGGWMPPEKVTMVARAVADACDALDGLPDGVVNNYYACPPRFDPRTLRCPGGVDAGTGCLSNAQTDLLAGMQSPHTLPFPLANGVTEYPGWLWGAEDGPGAFHPWIMGAMPPRFPPEGRHSIHWTYGQNVIRYFIAQDAKFDPRQYRPEEFRKRVEQLSALMDATDPDLARFRSRGGKLILRENMGDYAQSPLAGIEYYRSVVAKLGQDRVDDFIRLYASTGSTHAGAARSVTDGTRVPTSIDLLDALDTWVTQGKPPADALVQVRNSPEPPFETIASRPLCRHPNYPHYVGGDRNDAKSFACRPSKPY